MKEYTKAKILADIEQDLLQFLDEDQFKADVLSYLLDLYELQIEVKTQILLRYNDYLPVSDDKRVQQIRKIFAEDFLLKYPQHKNKVQEIFDKKYIAIEEQLAYVICYRIEGYTQNVYEVNIPDSTQTYLEGKNYLQSLASAVAGTPNAEILVQDDIASVIKENARFHLSDLAEKGIYPSVPVIAPKNNYSFLFNTTALLSGILSATSFVAAVLALGSIITISTAGVGWIASVGLVSGLVSFGIYNSTRESTKNDNLRNDGIVSFRA